MACNTATALAVPRLQEALKVPVLGVIAPGAAAAVAATRNGRVGVIGTHATISSGAYERALRKLSPDLEISAAPCPLFVPLIEEGLLEDPLTDQHITRYLRPLLDAGIDTLILGCTHYPLLKEAIAPAGWPGGVSGGFRRQLRPGCPRSVASRRSRRTPRGATARFRWR